MFPQLLHYPVSYFPCPQGHGAGPSGEADGPGCGENAERFLPGRSTTDAVFLVRQVQERYAERGTEL